MTFIYFKFHILEKKNNWIGTTDWRISYAIIYIVLADVVLQHQQHQQQANKFISSTPATYRKSKKYCCSPARRNRIGLGLLLYTTNG